MDESSRPATPTVVASCLLQHAPSGAIRSGCQHCRTQRAALPPAWWPIKRFRWIQAPEHHL